MVKRNEMNAINADRTRVRIHITTRIGILEVNKPDIALCLNRIVFSHSVFHNFQPQLNKSLRTQTRSPSFGNVWPFFVCQLSLTEWEKCFEPAWLYCALEEERRTGSPVTSVY